jgi:DNA-binding NtrC family response regulator
MSAAIGATDQLDVLVIDDDPAVRASFAMILRNAGYEVGEAQDGAVALAVLSSTRVGAMVLDVRMPKLDGLRLLDALPNPPPVVLMTAHDYDAEVMARRSKVFAYAQKPIPPESLRGLVAQALAQGV